jgi:hypothetical protein
MPSPVETKRLAKEQIAFKSGIGPLGLGPDEWTCSLYEPFERLPATSVAAGTNPNFILGGAGTETIAHSTTGGGLLLGTGGTDNNSVSLLPSTTSQWGVPRLANLSREHWLTSVVESGSTIAASAIIWGLKLTDTNATANPYDTDANQALIVYDTDAITLGSPASGQASISAGSTNFYFVYSIGGTDYAVDSGVKVAASTEYKFDIRIDLTGRATFYINDRALHTTPILNASAALLPYYAGYTREGVLKTNSLRFFKYLGR